MTFAKLAAERRPILATEEGDNAEAKRLVNIESKVAKVGPESPDDWHRAGHAV